MAATPDISHTPRRPVSPTIVDVASTVVDLAATSPVLSGADIPFQGDGDTSFTLRTARIIGAGGQGTVVEATDAEGTVFAAKLAWQPQSVRDRMARHQVLSYLRGLTRDHPLKESHYRQTHLMPILATGQVRDCLPELGETTYDVAVMPLCEGSYADRPLVSFGELRDKVISQAAEALHRLHEQGIVHRDVKPKNLYVLNGQVVLGDFGISSVLDAGRDTSATQIDRRTPGYSPHSSVVQRENDWYAFGYTLWTLYNGGVHPHQALIDADDLSAVLAGGRPVPFTPRKSAHACLGQLVYGLTYAYAQGRLGYDDVRRWLEDPASFRYIDPLAGGATAGTAQPAGYQFEGVVYDRPSTLVTALAQDWDRAKRHLYTGSLEEYFRQAGFHDVAVRLNDIVEGDGATAKGADEDLGLSLALRAMDPERAVFFWKGAPYPLGAAAVDVWVRENLATPLGFYRTFGQAGARDDLLGFLTAAGFAAQAQELGKRWETGCDPTAALVDRVLIALEAVAGDAEPVRAFARRFSGQGWALWVQENLGRYRLVRPEGRKLVDRVRKASVPREASVADTVAALAELADAADMLASHCVASPYESSFGVVGPAADVEPATGEAFFSARLFGRAVPQGFAGELMDASAADGDALGWAERDVLGAEAPELARKGAEALDEAAERLERLAKLFGSSRTIQGRGRFAFAALFAAALAFTVGVVALWAPFEQSAYEANVEAASSLVQGVQLAEAAGESAEAGADSAEATDEQAPPEPAESEPEGEGGETSADASQGDSDSAAPTDSEQDGDGSAPETGEPAPATGEAPFQKALQDFSTATIALFGQQFDSPEPFDVIGTFPDVVGERVVVESPELLVSPAGIAPNMEWPAASVNLSGIPLGVLLGWALVGFLAAAGSVLAEKLRHLAAAIGMAARRGRLRAAAKALREEARAIRADTSAQRPWAVQQRTDAVPVRARTSKLIQDETAFAHSLGLASEGDSSSGSATALPHSAHDAPTFARVTTVLFWGGAIAMMVLVALSTAAGFGIPLWDDFLDVFDIFPLPTSDFAYQVEYLVTTAAAFGLIALLKGGRRTMVTLALLMLSPVALIALVHLVAALLPIAIVLFILWLIFVR